MLAISANVLISHAALEGTSVLLTKDSTKDKELDKQNCIDVWSAFRDGDRFLVLLAFGHW